MKSWEGPAWSDSVLMPVRPLTTIWLAFPPQDEAKSALENFHRTVCLLQRWEGKVRGNGGSKLGCRSLRGGLGSETTGECGQKMWD